MCSPMKKILGLQSQENEIENLRNTFKKEGEDTLKIIKELQDLLKSGHVKIVVTRRKSV
jgi:hypothetical protein